jgi:hypothetical protein
LQTRRPEQSWWQQPHRRRPSCACLPWPWRAKKLGNGCEAEQWRVRKEEEGAEEPAAEANGKCVNSPRCGIIYHKGPHIATVQHGLRACMHIWPYTWRQVRASVAGHSAHYARKSRDHHHARRENRVRAVKSRQNRHRRLVNTVRWGPVCHVPSVTQRVTLSVRMAQSPATSSLMSWGRVENKQKDYSGGITWRKTLPSGATRRLVDCFNSFE